MRQDFDFVRRMALNAVRGSLVVVCLSNLSVYACTIFTLTDTNQTLFCNNEDWKDPNTRIWFVPSSRGRYGCAYVGFDNGWAQGGLNSEGLAYDWVAGYKARWQRDPKMMFTEGNPAERMLESCATVEEAIAFFQTHWEPSFEYARILIADRTGASVIIGSKDGELDIQRAKDSRGFGYAGPVVEKLLTEDSTPTVGNAAKILQAARQQGLYATKYSNVFDLKSGDIFFFRFPNQPDAVKLNLAAELKKGDHAYDLSKIDEQLKGESKRLCRLTRP